MNDTERKEFGDHVKRLRLSRGMSLRDAEKQIGISNSYLYQIERGERNAPKPEVLQKMAAVYQVTYASLKAAARLQEPEDDARYYQEDELERAFDYVRNDKRFAFGTHMSGETLAPEAKRFIVEMYQTLANRKLLSDEKEE